MSMTNLLLMIVVLFSGERCFAAPLEDVLKAPHNDPGYFSVVISLLFVICLIYATGIIYNKLNNDCIIKAQWNGSYRYCMRFVRCRKIIGITIYISAPLK